MIFFFISDFLPFENNMPRCSFPGIYPMHANLLQLCLTVCDPGDCSLPGSSVHGILQARILEWVAIPFSRGFSRARDQTRISCIADRFFTEPSGKPIVVGAPNTMAPLGRDFRFKVQQSKSACPRWLPQKDSLPMPEAQHPRPGNSFGFFNFLVLL